MEKNNDALHASLEQLIAVSKDPFIKKLFPEAAKPTGGVNTKKLVLISVGSKFRVRGENNFIIYYLYEYFRYSIDSAEQFIG